MAMNFPAPHRASEAPAFQPARIPAVRFTMAAIAILVAGMMPGGSSEAAVISVGRDASGHCDQPTPAAAIARARELGGHNEIRLSLDAEGSGEWHDQHLEINDQQLAIIGGFANCDAPAPEGRSTLLAGSSQQGPVLSIRGGDVKLKGLRIAHGSGDDSTGAAIDYEGNGTLVLSDVSVDNNNVHSAEGHALRFHGAGANAFLHFLGNVSVADNGGGGVRVSGSAGFTLHGPDNEVARNQGDGLLVEAPAVAQIGATGDVFAHNAGVGVRFTSANVANDTSLSRLYSTDEEHPLQIVANKGGALALNWSSGTMQVVCIRNVHIVGNGTDSTSRNDTVAVGGRGSVLSLNGSCSPPPDAVDCDKGPARCNIVAGNRTSAGSLIHAFDGGRVHIERVLFVANDASSILATNVGTAASRAAISMYTSVVIYNELGSHLFEAAHFGEMDIRNSTIANNTGEFPASLAAIGPRLLQVAGSIIDQPQALLELDGSPSSARFEHVLAQNSIGTVGDILVGRPTFIDALGRLDPASLGVDHAPASGGTDFDGNARDVDIGGVADMFGPRDLGAFETQTSTDTGDPVFSDGFESRVAR